MKRVVRSTRVSLLPSDPVPPDLLRTDTVTSRIAFGALVLATVLIACKRTPKVISTSTVNEPSGTTLATVVGECHGATLKACEGEALGGVINACPWEAPRHEVKVTKTVDPVLCDMREAARSSAAPSTAYVPGVDKVKTIRCRGGSRTVPSRGWYR